MGNSLRKAAQGPIDGGSVRSPVLGVDDRGSSEVAEYDSGAVKKLIMARRMAPFYEGQAEATTIAEAPDPPSPASSPTSDSARSLSASPPPTTARRKRHGLFRSRKRDDFEELPAVKQLLREINTECPICFLYYPRNVNYTECCRQNICTSCFLSLRRPPSGRTISCPFCNCRDFSIAYKPPIVLLKEEGLEEGDQRRLFNPHPVKWESLRPYRPPPPPVRRPQHSAAYRTATTTQLYRLHSGPSYSVRSARNVATVGGGVLVLYDENGRAQYFRTHPSQPTTGYNPHYYQQQLQQSQRPSRSQAPNPSQGSGPNQPARRDRSTASYSRQRTGAYYSGFAHPGQYYPEETLRFAAMY